MSKKNERVQKLIALDNMLRYQKTDRSGSAKFSLPQIEAALQTIEEILKLDNITKLYDSDEKKAGE